MSLILFYKLVYVLDTVLCYHPYLISLLKKDICSYICHLVCGVILAS